MELKELLGVGGGNDGWVKLDMISYQRKQDS